MNTSAYCQARARLPQTYVDRAFKSVVKHLEAKEEMLISGRSVRVVDGSSCSMPDTRENQELYPQPQRQKPGCGFPVMRFVALFSLETGAVLETEQGPLSDHERTLWRRLWHKLKKGDIALADRGFCSFAEYYLLLQRGVDSVMRLHARRKKGIRKIKRIAKGDWIVEWTKTNSHPNWMKKTEWEKLPDTIQLRHIKICVTIPGFRTQSLTIATTLINAKAYPPKLLAALYRRRWAIELFLRDIKITMGMDVLRCKSPALIQKEFVMHLIAYNFVRILMLEAARRHRRDIFRLSLAGTVAAIRQWAPSFVGIRSTTMRRAHLNALFQLIANDILPNRPNRIQPRAIKRRPKNYQLLTSPRHIFKEIYHRNKYEKGLT